MEIVYVVEFGCVGDTGIAGIFSSRDKAEKFYNKMGGKDNFYQRPIEYIVDEQDFENPYDKAIKELTSYADSSWGGLSDSFKLAIEVLKEKIN